MKETIKRAIETDDTAILLECLEDCYSTAFKDNYQEGFAQEMMHISYNHIYAKLKAIADKNGIKPQGLPLIDEIKAKLGQIKTEFYQHKNYDVLNLEYKRLHEMSRQYIADFIPYAGQLTKVLNNPELIDRKQELIDKWAEEDKSFPLETPRMVFNVDQDGWPIDDSEHLETEDEVDKRISDTLKYREDILARNEFGSSRELFEKWYQFICNIKELASINEKLIKNIKKTFEKNQEIKLEEFKSDSEFYNELLKIMDHNKKKEMYWYHGTQDVESAHSIIEQGLVMARDDLTTTAYSEFAPDQLLLYSRGFGGEIGSDAIVMFKQPIDENGKYIDIIKKNTKKLKVTQSGLGGFQDKLSYIIPSEYMVGIVNKRDHKIIYANELVDNKNISV